MDSVAVMDLFEGLNGPEQMEAADNSGQEQDAPDSGHHTSVQTSSSVASCANTVTVLAAFTKRVVRDASRQVR